VTHLVGHDTETASLLSSPSSLNGGIEREQIGLPRQFLDLRNAGSDGRSAAYEISHRATNVIEGTAHVYDFIEQALQGTPPRFGTPQAGRSRLAHIIGTGSDGLYATNHALHRIPDR
jgi:hypothetical protein